MHPTPNAILAAPETSVAIVLGTNEIASAVAVHLTAAGHAVILSHDPFPPVIRRAMAFDDALWDGRAVVAGVTGLPADSSWEIDSVLARPAQVVVTPLHLTDLIALRSPDVLVDARMQKHRMTPDFRHIARLTVGLGPNFAIGVNCDVAVETRPVHVGRLVRAGSTETADGVARLLGGVGRDRFVYSAAGGAWRTGVAIGTPVAPGEVLGALAGQPVTAPIGGVVRGIARDGTYMPADVKLLEIDPRGATAGCWTGIDERGRAIAEAVVQAVRERARPALPATAHGAA